MGETFKTSLASQSAGLAIQTKPTEVGFKFLKIFFHPVRLNITCVTIEENNIYPTTRQALMWMIICQYLSNFYREIQLFPFSDTTGKLKHDLLLVETVKTTTDKGFAISARFGFVDF
ncbi:DUF6888 family protein [Nostoc sp.]|uniref:DUF6888 family protein n=1 Tax=Nostoc sp. TaxID=1180 RepID=UPI003FA593BC